MLSPEDIRRRAGARYPDFLRSVVNGSEFFPLGIRFGKPSATEDFEKLRREITALTEADLGCRVDWTEVNSRRWGRQRLPERVEFADEPTYLRALGKMKEAARFRENLATTREQCPALLAGVEARPLEMVEFAEVWPGLVEVCRYFQAHPRPNLYARELPLSVDTKFVEHYQAVLSRLLVAVVPPESLAEADRFEERFGLRFDEPQIRVRLLDEALGDKLRVPFADFAVPLGLFRSFDWRDLRLVVVENKMTFLTLPPVAEGVAIWGAGNAAALLHGVTWLAHCRIFYWGDLDVQGLEILSRLRSVFPGTRSVMMDGETLGQLRGLCCAGTPVERSAPAYLTASELKAWAMVQAGNFRLEQERIPTAFVRRAIVEAFSGAQ